MARNTYNDITVTYSNVDITYNGESTPGPVVLAKRAPGGSMYSMQKHGGIGTCRRRTRRGRTWSTRACRTWSARTCRARSWRTCRRRTRRGRTWSTRACRIGIQNLSGSPISVRGNRR